MDVEEDSTTSQTVYPSKSQKTDNTEKPSQIIGETNSQSESQSRMEDDVSKEVTGDKEQDKY
jgi:hypothetical protein